MRIDRVVLENIRSYTSASITFPEGTILLSGDIGSGKTTVLLAIEFALFGIIRGELAPENLLRHGTNQGSVELTFTLNEKTYIVKRKLKRGKNAIAQDAGYLIVDEVKQEGTAIELKAKILNLLGYPDELVTKSKSLIYRYTVFTPQEQMKRILTDQAEYRLGTLRQVFGVDRYQRVAENVEIVRRMLKERAATLAGQLAPITEQRRQLETLRKQREALATQLDELAPKIRDGEAQKISAQRALVDAESTMRMAMTVQQHIAALEAELREKTAAATQNAKELEQLKASVPMLTAQRAQILIEAIPEPATAVRQRIVDQEQELQGMLSAIAATIAKQQTLQREEAELQKRMAQRAALLAGKATLEQNQKTARTKAELHASASAKLETLQQTHREFSTAIQRASTQVEQANALQERMQKLGECPTCLQPVSETHKHRIHTAQEELRNRGAKQLTELKQREAELLRQKQHCQNEVGECGTAVAQLAKIEAQLAALQQHEQEQQRDQQRLTAMTAERQSPIDPKPTEAKKQELAISRKQLERIQLAEAAAKQRQLLDTQIADTERRLRELEATQATIKQRIGTLNGELLPLNEQRKQFAAQEALLAKAKEDLTRIEQDITRLVVQQASLGGQQQSLQQSITALEQACAAGKVAEQQLRRTQELERWLSESFCNVLGVMEKQVMLNIQREFSQLFREWFGILIEDPMIAARLDDTFNPIIEQNGFETDIESLSGGERTALALAYRLALNKVINTLITTIQTRDLIVLDEPTDGFSTEQLDRVREVLQQLGMKQVIIVSHEGKIEGFVDQVIRIGKEGHESKLL